MDLQGKRLLLMGGAAFIQDIRRYADLEGFSLIAVGAQRGAHADAADEYYPIDTRDIDAISHLVTDKHIDGLFVGANESNIPPAIEVAERTGMHFYCTREQWKILSDKAIFKQLLKKHGLPLIPEYDEDQDATTIDYPIIVKPVDGSGARGITVCRKAEDFKHSVEYAKEFSPSGRVIIEKFFQGMDDTFVRYHFQDGKYSISGTFDKYSDFSKGGFAGMPLIYKHPTRHLDAYVEKFDKKIQNLFKDLGLMNGVITLQGFVDENEDFYFYEAGYRLGGSQSYIFTDAVNKSNSLYYMINYALTGEMADFCIADRDNPYLTKSCCNQYIPLNGGVLTTMEGIDELRCYPGVLNITEMCRIGTTIEANGNLNQVCLRMHLMADNPIDLDYLLATVDTKLSILDENGDEMRMRHIRCVADAMR